MTDKELKRLSREELLQLMILQAEENKRLKEEVEQLRRQMEQNQIMMNEAGSIAEASLRLHQVFETAQAAANTYLDNIRQMHNRQQAYCNGLIARANEEALEIIRKAKERYEDEV